MVDGADFIKSLSQKPAVIKDDTNDERVVEIEAKPEETESEKIHGEKAPNIAIDISEEDMNRGNDDESKQRINELERDCKEMRQREKELQAIISGLKEGKNIFLAIIMYIFTPYSSNTSRSLEEQV